MPLYEYRCRACQQVTEVRHGFGEGFAGACPACGAAEMARVFNPAGIVFKGSGFYINDSRKAAAGSAEKASSETPAAGSTPAGAPAPAATAPAPAAAPAPAPAASDAGSSKKSESSAA